MEILRLSQFVGYQALGGGAVRFRTAGCGTCAYYRDLHGAEAVIALRRFATLLRERADEADRVAGLIESLQRLADQPTPDDG